MNDDQLTDQNQVAIKQIRCRKCKQRKPEDAFHQRYVPPSFVRMGVCKDCYVGYRNWRQIGTPLRSFKERMYTNVLVNNGHSINAGSYGDLTLDQWMDILDRSQGNCHHCNNHVGIEYLVIDHLYPVARGGACTVSNIVASCRSCNASKKDSLNWKPVGKVVSKERPDTPADEGV